MTIATDFDWTVTAGSVIAGMSAIAVSAVGGYFSYKAARRTKTSNGATSGELIELIAESVNDLSDQLGDAREEMAANRDDVALLKLWTIEHLRSHERP